MDIQKQIEYWVKSSEEDFAAAQSLLEKGRFGANAVERRAC